jgi:excisionase family DNA binding protein
VNLDDLEGRGTISVPEAGQLLGIGRNAAYDAVERGEIPTLRLGRTLRVPVPKLIEMLTGQEPSPRPPSTIGVKVIGTNADLDRRLDIVNKLLDTRQALAALLAETDQMLTIAGLLKSSTPPSG